MAYKAVQREQKLMILIMYLKIQMLNVVVVIIITSKITYWSIVKDYVPIFNSFIPNMMRYTIIIKPLINSYYKFLENNIFQCIWDYSNFYDKTITARKWSGPCPTPS